ncbi:hypothetical protein CASFOL_023105 [Castilleja foliolosa]|uniref:Homeobox domain-containing protein n=1 Tax=Castilleja foliolosa TaxID=1961234 RepID=A0ABD3CLB8_9LAMI
MEQQQQQHEQVVIAIDAGKSSTTSSNYNLSSSARQSSTRWSPTSEQIRILKELYYNNGVRSPSAEQIQRISAKLRQYGKIEGKNVFYWFQNHKARERQKKRFTSSSTTHHQDHHHNMNIISQPTIYYNNNNNNNIFHNSTNIIDHTGNNGYGYGYMEKSFRECSIGSGSTWIGFDPYSSCFVDDQQKITADKTLEMVEEEEEQEEIETLALFPMHGDIILKQQQQQQQQARPGTSYTSSDYINLFKNPGDDDDHVAATSRASNLELTLNSYNYIN